MEKRFFVEGLCFLPIWAHRQAALEITQFSFLRVLRRMPKMRGFAPHLRRVHAVNFTCELPQEDALSLEPRVAIFDGGLSPSSPLTKWVTPIDPPGIGKPVNQCLEHGHDVTSALLFGPLSKSSAVPRPFSKIDHYRVFDEKTGADDDHLFDVLERIRTALKTNNYNFVNLSIGPAMPIEDTEVHAWTAFLDSHLSSGTTLVTVACGNNGDEDVASGNARIQTPADCVNALSVGACDSVGKIWRRASYSGLGPGRSPGIVKPDLLGFGGTSAEPFCVINPSSNQSLGTSGTSFASPATLRTAIAVRSCLGNAVGPLALKALLIHCAHEPERNHIENGWGRAPLDYEDIIHCPARSARILYQGELSRSEYLRAQIPIPSETVEGKCFITATFCYCTEVDPQDPGNYTRSGLVITFRPHAGRKNPMSRYAKSASFFGSSNIGEEQHLRDDAHKWETTLHAKVGKFGSGLMDPVFDIHHNCRESGGPSRTSEKIRYALVVTVETPKEADIYNKVFRRYRAHLRPLAPIITLPVRL